MEDDTPCFLPEQNEETVNLSLPKVAVVIFKETLMTTSNRKELLVHGWIRENHDLPIELNKIIESFSRDVIEWLVEGKRFEDFFYPTNHSDEQATISKILAVEGIEMKLVGDPNRYVDRFLFGGYCDVLFSLKIDRSSLLKDTQSLKIEVQIEGNIDNNKYGANQYGLNHYELYYDLTECDGHICDMFGIGARQDIYNEYDKFDIKFYIEIKEIKYHKMQIQQQLKWELNADDINIINEGSLDLKKNTDDWSLQIRSTTLGVFRKLMLRPLTLPALINLITVEYNLEISCDGKNIIKTQNVSEKMNKYGKTIYGWAQKAFEFTAKYEIVLISI